MNEEIKTTDEQSSQNEKITSVVKTKDPRRVEAGKRLGMISKQAKEKKAREQSEQNKAVEVKEKNDDWFPPISLPVVGIGFVGLVGLVLYYGYDRVAGYNKKYKSLTSNVKDGSKTQNSNLENKTKPKRVYKELDTLD